MANKESNFPSNQLNHLKEGVSTEIVTSLRELSAGGKPETIEELKIRIDDYFKFCGDRDFRPGIESLCLSLGVSRQAYWNWCAGSKGEEWQTECIRARQFCLTFLEQLNLTGRLNPASAIFYLKNWASYKDSISFDDVPSTLVKQSMSTDSLPIFNFNDADNDG